MSASAPPATPFFLSTSGPVVGIVTSNNGTAFLGVPFAAPPVRWAPPRPPTPWTQPRAATSYAPGCAIFRAADGKGEFEGEDCLYLNVWVPGRRTAGAPLIVFIHGGGMVTGDASGDLSLYAAGAGAVIVSISYRLGSLGFLALPGMAPAYPPPAAEDSACANVGLLDQQAALAWARANAAALGADPEHILISGQSAGGMSVLYHLTLPSSYGLYRAAFAQSPGTPANTLLAGQATAAAIAARVNCAPSSGGFAQQLACLRATPVDALVAAAVAVSGTHFNSLTLGPVVDGVLVTASPTEKMRAGDFNRDASVLLLENLFEGDSLLAGCFGTTAFTPALASAALKQMGYMTGLNASSIASVAEVYAPIAAQDGLFNGSSRLWGDGLLTCPVAWAARGAAAYSAHPVHRILINVSYQGQPMGRATHNSEIPILFDGWYSPPLAQDMWAWLANAAVTGDVNVGPLNVSAQWPRYTYVGGGGGGAGAGGKGKGILSVDRAHEYTTIGSWQEEFCDTLWLPLLP